MMRMQHTALVLSLAVVIATGCATSRMSEEKNILSPTHRFSEEDLTEMLPKALDCLKHGFVHAWAVESAQPSGNRMEQSMVVLLGPPTLGETNVHVTVGGEIVIPIEDLKERGGECFYFSVISNNENTTQRFMQVVGEAIDRNEVKALLVFTPPLKPGEAVSPVGGVPLTGQQFRELSLVRSGK